MREGALNTGNLTETISWEPIECVPGLVDLLSTAISGCDALRVSSMEPIETKIMMTMMNAREPFMKIDQNIARGIADFVILVSSLI